VLIVQHLFGLANGAVALDDQHEHPSTKAVELFAPPVIVGCGRYGDAMILDRLTVPRSAFEDGSGWDEWPYESDWLTEVRAMGAENYYPRTR
jgi:hypothetical protein